MLNRRLFLKSTALIGCSAAAHPLLSTISMAALPGDNRLVVIILRGAMDGLDVLQPYGDPALRDLRQTLSKGPEGGALDLDGFFALHPSMAPLMPLWQQGELGFVSATSTPYRDKRSHFDGQDMLEAGTGTDLALHQQRSGWLNRLLQEMPGATSETAYTVGVEQMLLLTGQAHALSWSPHAHFYLSPQAQQLLEHAYHDDPLFQSAAQDATEIVALRLRNSRGRGQVGPKELASFAASRLNSATRLASFSLPGWDTHVNQTKPLARALERLTASILALREGLGGNWSKTVVMAMTEFGRTARENGSRGTDHGTGGTLIMAGGALQGGRVLDDWPGLGEGQLYAGRDVMPTRDIRAYAAWAMHGLFGMDRTTLETRIFPGLDMGPDPGILR